MRKGKSVIGLRVVSQSESTQIGNVKDLIFDHDANQLVALLLSEKDLFGLIDAQIVPWEKVRKLGDDVVLVESIDSKIKAGDDRRVSQLMQGDSVLSGTQILTSDGRNLGTFADLFIDEDTGRVVGYEVSGGFVSDTLSGKHFLPAPREVAVGQHVVIVPPVMTEQLETQQQQLGESLRSLAGKVSDAYSQLAGASIEKQKEYVIGKTAGRDVLIPTTGAQAAAGFNAGSGEPASGPTDDLGLEGEVLVSHGEIITREHTERAVAAGVLGQLVLAAVGGAAGESYAVSRERFAHSWASATTEARLRAAQAAIGARASTEVIAPDGSVIVEEGETITAETIEKARLYDREPDVLLAAGVGTLRTGTGHINEQAGSLWDSLKQTVSHFTGTIQDKMAERDAQAEQARIDEALGRPVDRVIFDRDDNIILNSGDLVTNKAVARARDAGMLEILLASAGGGGAGGGSRQSDQPAAGQPEQAPETPEDIGTQPGTEHNGHAPELKSGSATDAPALPPG